MPIQNVPHLNGRDCDHRGSCLRLFGMPLHCTAASRSCRGIPQAGAQCSAATRLASPFGKRTRRARVVMQRLERSGHASNRAPAARCGKSGSTTFFSTTFDRNRRGEFVLSGTSNRTSPSGGHSGTLAQASGLDLGSAEASYLLRDAETAIVTTKPSGNGGRRPDRTLKGSCRTLAQASIGGVHRVHRRLVRTVRRETT